MLGMDVSRAGVQLLYQGNRVGVDPACSGMNMLWSTGLLTALLAAVFSLKWKNLVLLGGAALGIALLGNSLRAAILFFPEAGLVEMPHIFHSGIGIVIAGGGFLILMKLSRKLSADGALTSVGVPSPVNTLRPALALTLSIASFLVVLTSIFSKQESNRVMATPPVLTSYQGTPITRIALSPAEENFYGNFPGSIAVYESADFKLIVRQVNSATRKLHPASHCLSAEGFQIGEKTVVENADGERWLSYSITRAEERMQVKERISNPATHQSWPEISAWYWHAFLHPGSGPWEAVTAISE